MMPWKDYRSRAEKSSATVPKVADEFDRVQLAFPQAHWILLDLSDDLSQTIRPDLPPWTDVRSTLAPAGLSSEVDQGSSSIRERAPRRERPAILAADRHLSAVCADIWHSAGCRIRRTQYLPASSTPLRAWLALHQSR